MSETKQAIHAGSPLDELLAKKRKAKGEEIFRPKRRLRGRLLWGAAAVAILLAAAYFTGLLGSEPVEPVEPVAQSPPPVISATGPVVPERRARLSFTTSGKLMHLAVQPGDQVRKGQLLAQLEPASMPVGMPGSTSYAGAADQYITAPFDGTVGLVLLREWETVQPGVPVVVLGDLTRLRVELEDLSEKDVGRLREGQRAEISFESFPGRVVAGRVARISPMDNSRGGGVNYDVVVEFVGADLEGLRWGMTAHVDVLVGQEPQP
jgi:multidrug efflux pump subunit AcrA (membrane-fusion protein)